MTKLTKRVSKAALVSLATVVSANAAAFTGENGMFDPATEMFLRFLWALILP